MSKDSIINVNEMYEERKRILDKIDKLEESAPFDYCEDNKEWLEKVYDLDREDAENILLDTIKLMKDGYKIEFGSIEFSASKPITSESKKIWDEINELHDKFDSTMRSKDLKEYEQYLKLKEKFEQKEDQ